MSNTTAFPASCSASRAASISALCAAMAVDALGAERVHCGDAALPLHLAGFAARRGGLRQGARRSLRHRADRRAVEGVRTGARAACSPAASATSPKKTSRAAPAALILMSISNKFGAMVVTTGNKSEMSVGYATLYGDMNGGFNPIKDIYKTEVFELSATCATAGSRRRRAGPWRRHSPGDHRQAALGRIARGPEGRGFAAALSGARRDPVRPGREGDARRRHRRRGLRRRRPCSESSGCSISPNTSAASRRRASRSARRTSAAIVAIRSSTASAMPAAQRRRPTPRLRRAARWGWASGLRIRGATPLSSLLLVNGERGWPRRPTPFSRHRERSEAIQPLSAAALVAPGLRRFARNDGVGVV